MDDKYQALRLKNQLCFPLYLCAKEVTRRYQPMLDRLDLTYTQYIVMMYFWEMGSGSARDLSRAVTLDPSTLTPILKRLDQKGYLTRARDPRDERSMIISLTAAGRALQDDALQVPARMADCLGLSEAEAVRLGGLLGKILANIETKP
ncbi:MAG: MarR family transcriptional regulator [Clostridiales bacterium]|nr:MarR family transcriptional regulator [Clostridiales bacterium]